MSVRPNFAILESAATQAGQPWQTTVEGDTVTARNKGMVVIAKDLGGLARIPLVDSTNRLVVNAEGDDVVDLKGVGDNAGSNSPVTLFDITLQADTEYKNLEWALSCFREATFELLHIDDLNGTPVETILATLKVGAGDYSNVGKQTARFTTGAVGDQVLRVRASNLNATSQLEASASIQEVQ